MGIFKGRKKKYRNENITDILTKIRNGDYLERENFIEENKSTILKIVCDTLGKSTITKNSIEFEIGISAFNSALDSYDINSKGIFLSYVEKVIKEYIISYLRNKQSNEPSADFAADEKSYLYYSTEDKEKLSTFKNKLWELDIVLQDLVLECPTDDSSVQSALKIAKTLAENDKTYKKLFAKKDIPYEDLDDNTKAQKKYIEKYKKYILVLCVIIKEDLKIIHSYFKNVENGKGFAENIGLVLEIYKNQAILITFQGRFVITKIRSFNDMVIGKQIKLDNLNIKSASPGKIGSNRIYILAAAVLVLFIVFLFTFLYFSDQGTVTVVSESSPRAAYTPLNTTPTEPIATEAVNDVDSKVPTPEVATEVPTPEAATEAPSPTVTQKTNVEDRPTMKATAKPKPTRIRPTPVPTSNKAKNTQAPKIHKASGVPGVPVINSDLYVVRVGEKYRISMDMNGGNNATSLILYENDDLLSVKQLTDNTPNAQSSSYQIVAKYEGMYKYRWELVNEFGTVRSSTIWVNVVSK